MTLGRPSSINKGSSTTAAAATPNNRNPPCKYTRKHQGRYPDQAPGTPCGRRHAKGLECWAKKDDSWLSANPGKGPSDLPNWRLVGKQAGQVAGAAMSSSIASVSSGHGPSSVPGSRAFEEGHFLGYLCPLKEDHKGQQDSQGTRACRGCDPACTPSSPSSTAGTCVTDVHSSLRWPQLPCLATQQQASTPRPQVHLSVAHTLGKSRRM